MSTAAAARTDKVVSEAADWRILLRLLAYLRPYRTLVAVQLGLMALASAFQVAPTLLVREAIDTAIPNGDGRLLFTLVGGYLLLVVAEFGTRFSSFYAMMLTGQGVVRDLRKAIFRRIQRLDQATFDRTPVGRLLVRTTNDVEALEEVFASGVTAILGDVFKLALMLVLMLVLDARLTLAALALTPPFLFLSIWFRSRIRDAYRNLRARLSALNAYLSEVLLGVRVVRLFAQEDAERRRFGERNGKLLDDQLRSVRYDSVYSALVEMLSTFAVAAVIWYGGGQTLQGAVTLGTLYVFIEYATQFFTPLQELSQKVATLQSAMASSERIFALIDETDSIRSPERPAALPAPAGRVEFREVTFAYPGAEPALRSVSFEVAPGRVLALVGATGSGKTTITRLLTRLHDVPRGRPESDDPETTPGGEILLDGVDVRDYPLDDLRRRVGVVLQDPFLFSGTLRENLFLEKGTADEDARAWQALETVGADDVAKRLGGLEGLIAERGGNISAGEAQLLTFARALLYDPAVLLLDEATAAVDTLTERRIQAALAKVLEGRTAIVVAHRLSTIRQADQILVLHHGEIRERGTHAELLAQKGLYERLYRLQFEETAG